jgi:hypothetical protein
MFQLMTGFSYREIKLKHVSFLGEFLSFRGDEYKVDSFWYIAPWNLVVDL